MMQRLIRILDSSVGYKIIIAATGVALIGFVVVHMLGNLQIFFGADALNAYAKKLKDLGTLLWVARSGLIVAFIVHIAATIRLTIKNRQVSGSRYAGRRYQASSVASRSMIWTGLAVLLFVAFHLTHFTFGWVQPAAFDSVDSEGRHDVYAMVVAGFENWLIALFYIVALILLAMHLSHATFSLLRTLGGRVGNESTWARRAAIATSVVIIVGFIVVPVAVVLGITN